VRGVRVPSSLHNAKTVGRQARESVPLFPEMLSLTLF